MFYACGICIHWEAMALNGDVGIKQTSNRQTYFLSMEELSWYHKLYLLVRVKNTCIVEADLTI